MPQQQCHTLPIRLNSQIVRFNLNLPSLFFIPFVVLTQVEYMGAGVILGTFLCWMGYKMRVWIRARNAASSCMEFTPAAKPRLELTPFSNDQYQALTNRFKHLAVRFRFHIPSLFFLPFVVLSEVSYGGLGIILGAFLCWLGYKTRRWIRASRATRHGVLDVATVNEAPAEQDFRHPILQALMWPFEDRVKFSRQLLEIGIFVVVVAVAILIGLKE